MIDISPLFTLAFWFNLQPVALSPFFAKALFFLFSGLMIVGSVARMVAKNRKEDKLLRDLYRRIASAFLLFGALGMLWYFFAFEEIYLFSARFWFLFWFIGVIGMTVYLIRYARSIPQIRATREARSVENKYLPRRNR